MTDHSRSTPRKVAFVGSRDGMSADDVEYWVQDRASIYGHGMIVVTGGARGVDRAAEQAARALGLPEPVVIRPDYSSAAAPKLAPKYRNWEIARECDELVAIWDGYSTGTSHAVACAVRLGKPVKIVMDGDS
jgi:hypothetical protein